MRKMHTKFENYMAERIEQQLNQPLYENMFNQNTIENIVDRYVLIDYQLTVKDDMATIELQEAPTEDSTFDDCMWSKELTLKKLNGEGGTANYQIHKTDSTDKKDAEEKMITVWLTTQKDDHDTWDWDGNVLTLLDKQLEPVNTYTRKQLSTEIESFPQD